MDPQSGIGMSNLCFMNFLVPRFEIQVLNKKNWKDEGDRSSCRLFCKLYGEPSWGGWLSVSFLGPLTRPWIGCGVSIAVRDGAPWVLSSRRPDALTVAVRAGAGIPDW